jgi:hypothetical protein
MSDNVQSYGQCIAAMCIMPSREVTFLHKWAVCEGLLHVPCRVTNLNDKTLCHNCWARAKEIPCANTRQWMRMTLWPMYRLQQK